MIVEEPMKLTAVEWLIIVFAIMNVVAMITVTVR
mgnify:FL=1